MKAMLMALSLVVFSSNAFAYSYECSSAGTKEEIIECLKNLEKEKARLIQILIQDKKVTPKTK